MIVECISYKEVNVGTFAGFVDVALPEYRIEIYGCTVYKKDDKRWVNLPVRIFKSPEGIEKYAPIIRFREPKEFREFCEKVKVSIDEFKEKDDEQFRTEVS